MKPAYIVLIVLTTLFTVLLWLGFSPDVRSDGRFYFYYCKSFFIEHHINNKTSPFPIGSAILDFPFYLVGHVIAKASPQWRTDGFGKPYLIAYTFGGVFYGLLSIWVMFKLWQPLTNRRSAFWAAMACFYGTPLIFYSTYESSMSHAPDVFARALLAYFLLIRFDKHRRLHWFVLGLIAGISGLTRWINLLTSSIVMAVACFESIKNLSWQKQNVVRTLTNILLLGTGFLVFVFPQAYILKATVGSWFTIPQGASFLDLSSPQIFGMLFSWKRGFFLWHPLFVVCFVGLGWLFYHLIKKDSVEEETPHFTPQSFAWLTLPRLMAGLFGIWLVELYVNSGVLDWWGGTASFGSRRLLGMLFFYGLGLVWIVMKWRAMKWRWALKTLVIMLVAFNVSFCTLHANRQVDIQVFRPTEIVKKSIVQGAFFTYGLINIPIAIVKSIYRGIPLKYFYLANFPKVNMFKITPHDRMVLPYLLKTNFDYGEEHLKLGQWWGMKDYSTLIVPLGEREWHCTMMVKPFRHPLRQLEGLLITVNDYQALTYNFKGDIWQQVTYTIPEGIVLNTIAQVDIHYLLAEGTDRLQLVTDKYTVGSTGVMSKASLLVESAGFGEGYIAHCQVEGRNYSKERRGYNCVMLAEDNQTVDEVRAFDIFSSEAEFLRMKEWIGTIPQGRIVLVALKDFGPFFWGDRQALEANSDQIEKQHYYSRNKKWSLLGEGIYVSTVDPVTRMVKAFKHFDSFKTRDDALEAYLYLLNISPGNLIVLEFQEQGDIDLGSRPQEIFGLIGAVYSHKLPAVIGVKGALPGSALQPHRKKRRYELYVGLPREPEPKSVAFREIRFEVEGVGNQFKFVQP